MDNTRKMGKKCFVPRASTWPGKLSGLMCHTICRAACRKMFRRILLCRAGRAGGVLLLTVLIRFRHIHRRWRCQVQRREQQPCADIKHTRHNKHPIQTGASEVCKTSSKSPDTRGLHCKQLQNTVLQNIEGDNRHRRHG